jgi:hypothetical protein
LPVEALVVRRRYLIVMHRPTPVAPSRPMIFVPSP